MDLSKLPKLSDTAKHAPPASADDPVSGPPASAQGESPAPPRQLEYSPYRRNAIGLAETWISIGVGLFLLLYYPRFLQWASSRVFHTHFNEFLDNNTGAVVPYQTVPAFWMDLGPTLLGIVLIVDGLLLFSRRPLLVLLALFLTAISTAYNLWYVIHSYSDYGLAPISFLAVIFGGFIFFTQWTAFQSLRRR